MSDKSTPRYNPAVLIIIDGWGVAPFSEGNAIARARTPYMDSYISRYPTTTLVSYGDAVGLRWGEMGNSEVGHLNIGAGFVFYQNLPRIYKEIETGAFYQNETLLRAVAHVTRTKGVFHVMGIVSSGGVHGHIDHLYALLEFCKQQKITKIALHGFLDGRDAVYNSGISFIRDIQAKAEELGVKLMIASLSGRFYAMDRDNRWDRTAAAYNAMVYGEGVSYEGDPSDFLEEQYDAKTYDEQITPTVFTKKQKPLAIVEDGDVVVFFNFRSDRARQITKAFVVPEFESIPQQKKFTDLFFATMVEYEKNVPVEVIYPPIMIREPLAKAIADAGLTQLHIAETEKYAHVTFFLNGGAEEPFPNEERRVITSPKVTSYDKAPDMKAKEIADQVIKAVSTGSHDVIILNFANPDMVGHTGNLKATIQACEVVDAQIGRIVEAVLAKNGLVAITADHGNAEEVLNLQTNDTDKEHSTNPVPFIVIANDLEGQNMGLPEAVGGDLSLVQPSGILADVAPTFLSLLGIQQPDSMTGAPLIDVED